MHQHTQQTAPAPAVPTHPTQNRNITMPNIYESEELPVLLQIAENTSTALADEGFMGGAALVGELATRLAAAEVTAQLADEGIGQRPPIALLLAGKGEQDFSEYVEARGALTLNGFIVLEHTPPAVLDDEDTASMSNLLRQKILLADVVDIVNDEGIDEALLPFIEYAENNSRPVQYSYPNA